MAHLTTTIPVPADLTELLADHSLTLQELARACRMAPEWVHERVHEGVIGITQTSSDPRVLADDQGSWRFPAPWCCVHAALPIWNASSMPIRSWQRSPWT